MVTTAHSELKATKNTRKDYFSDLQNGNVWFPVQLRLPNPKGITKVSRGPSAEGAHGKFPIAKTLQRYGVPRADKFQLTVSTLFWQPFLWRASNRSGIKCPTDIQGCLWNGQRVILNTETVPGLLLSAWDSSSKEDSHVNLLSRRNLLYNETTKFPS